MEPALYMGQGVFVVIIIAALVGLGFTCILLLSMLFREFKDKTLW